MFATMLVWVKIQFDWKKNGQDKKKMESRAKKKSEKMP
jgi:hypothetical protein